MMHAKLTEIFIYAENVENSQIPVNAVYTINNSPIIDHIWFEA